MVNLLVNINEQTKLKTHSERRKGQNRAVPPEFLLFFIVLNFSNLLVKFNSLVESGCHRLLLRVIHAEKSAKKICTTYKV